MSAVWWALVTTDVAWGFDPQHVPGRELAWVGMGVAGAGVVTLGVGVGYLYSPGQEILTLEPGVETTTSLRTGTALFTAGVVTTGVGVAVLDLGALNGAYAVRRTGRDVPVGLGWAAAATWGVGVLTSLRSEVVGAGLFGVSGVLGAAQLANAGQRLHVVPTTTAAGGPAWAIGGAL